MGCVPALKTAVELLHLPSRAASVRAGPLPEGILTLLRVAAGDSELTNQVSASEGRSPDVVREAAAFFLEQVLLHADADSYRVLGATRAASYQELRHNMSLLLQWLHPDLDGREPRSVFAARVTRAWNDLKTPQRRAAYDRAQRLTSAEKTSLHPLRPAQMSSKKPMAGRSVHSVRRYRKYAILRQPLNPYYEFVRKTLLLWFGKLIYWK